ncbi:MAG: hypothetical protein MRY51_02715 [Flavobacteriaceae bacterium]|nr:hypothetical protein [Flavobacteriaceae bacterium]MCI5089155.1 hypothetical protein [Flavobacteriaceae bacterium]CAI8190842.1 MAG: Uncharacterised protein [SAR116 cluster bacterium]
MEKEQFKKSFVLGVLFILPLVAYLFFATGVNNFGSLPVLTESVSELPENELELKLENHISVVGFLGSDLSQRQVNMFNLNQKIYKRFSDFNDFQFVMIMPQGTQDQVQEVMDELSAIGQVSGWNFIYASEVEINKLFSSFKTNSSLDAKLGTDLVFIVDKSRSLRGRDGSKGEEILFGYNATAVSELTNTMIDDVKIILAEYRMALKKNNVYSQNK